MRQLMLKLASDVTSGIQTLSGCEEGASKAEFPRRLCSSNSASYQYRRSTSKVGRRLCGKSACITSAYCVVCKPLAAQPWGPTVELSAQPGQKLRTEYPRRPFQSSCHSAVLCCFSPLPHPFVTMSGAEFIAVIGIGASIVQLSEACHKILVRIRQYRDHSAFLELDTQIRLFSKHVGALQDPRAQTGLDSDLTADFIDLLGVCRRKIQELETLIECQIPQTDSNSFKRVSSAIRSLLKDRRLKGILDDLANFQRIMTLHLARATWNNQRDILQLLAVIERTASSRSNTAPSLDQPACNTSVPRQGVAKVLDHSLARRRQSRQSLCALGTCGCPCHSNKTRMGILGFAGPSSHMFQCCCTQSQISIDLSGLRRLVQFNMAFSWHNSLSVSFSLKYKRFVTYANPGLSLLNSSRFVNAGSPDYDATKTFSDFMRLCRSGHADLDDAALIDCGAFQGWKFYGGYLEVSIPT